jgi:hypothetical protein
MVDFKQLQSQIKSVSIDCSMNKKEVELLAQTLMPEERLIVAFQGTIEVKSYRVVLSEQRIYLISKAMFQDSQISTINLNDVVSVAGKPGWLLGKVILIDRDVNYEIINVSKKALNLFVQSVQGFLTQNKKDVRNIDTSDSKQVPPPKNSGCATVLFFILLGGIIMAIITK